jgi:hypothetical protein
MQLGARDEVDGIVWRVDQLAGHESIAPPVLRKLPFVTPRREGLPPLERYAHLIGPTQGETRTAGYVESSRGCLHRCRHCPVTPVYQGRFFVVPHAVVVADAEQQIAAGARHITFGDPDFFNGPKHGMRVIESLHQAHPGVSFDVTIKVEHLLRHPEYVARLPELGCLFVISALESLSDEVLLKLDKGHDRRDVFRLLAQMRKLGLPLRPTFVAFTPWTTLDDYIELVDWLIEEQLYDSVDPIQLAIRLLVPPGSALLGDTTDEAWLGGFDQEALGHPWTHPDPRMDVLFEQVSAYLAQHAGGDALRILLGIRKLACDAAGRTPATTGDTQLGARAFSPRMSESWFCCAEPNATQMAAAQRADGCPTVCAEG